MRRTGRRHHARESDYILLHTLLGTGNPERFQKCCNWILKYQNEDGGWGIYVDAPSNMSAPA